MGVSLRCSICREKFPWDTAKEFPKFCPVCGKSIGHDRADDEIVMPAILSAKSKASDRVYREMERGSEFRAQAAAEMAGTSVDEMSGVKITNLNDRKDAEIAAMPINNPVTQMMAAAPGVTGFQSNGAEYSGAVQSGPFANTGAKMRTAIHSAHASMVQQHAIGRGENGRPAVPMGQVTVDAPAKETLQPGYRRRG